MADVAAMPRRAGTTPTPVRSRRVGAATCSRLGRYGLRLFVLFYLAMLLLVPVGMVVYRTFQHGVSPVWTALSSPEATHAALVTIEVTAIAVPLNVVFGVATGWFIARRRMPLRPVVNALVDLPFAMSPVVIGLAVFILYGRGGWFGTWLLAHGITVLFSLPGMVLVTMFVSLPFVIRETVPVLIEVGTDQEQAAEVLGARSLQTFRRITLPLIRWSVVYGVVLSAARALGEYGAVSIVSGDIVDRTQTLPLYVEQEFRTFDPTAAYSAGLLLAVISLVILLGMSLLTRRRRDSERPEETP